MDRVIIAGSGRSGTTWVQDVIAEANDMGTLFEPLHPAGNERAKRFANRYYAAEVIDKHLEEYMDWIMSGQMRSIWAQYRVRPDRFDIFRYGVENVTHNARKLVSHYLRYRSTGKNGLAIKFIRANLMLPWIVKRYRFPMVLVVRHPGAVIASRFKLGGVDWDASKYLEEYRSDANVQQLIKYSFGIDLDDGVSAAGTMAKVWCIENLLPLRWSKEYGFIVTAYESLLSAPVREWTRVTKGLGLSVIPGINLLEKPSQQASGDMKGSTFSDNYLSKWREQLNEEQIGDISDVLDQFGCKYYLMEQDQPKLDVTCG